MTVISSPRATRLAFLSAIAALATSVSSFAQIGSAYTWTPYTDSNVHIQWETTAKVKSKSTIKVDRTQSDGIYDYTSSSNTEKFVLNGTNINRIEYRGKTYTSGVYQFEGRMRVTGLSDGDEFAVAQVFHSVLLKWHNRNGGTIRFHTASDFDNESFYVNKDIKTNANGVWVKVNMIHNASTNRIDVYIDNQKVIDNQQTGDLSEYYFKYGAYDNGGSDKETVEWKDVKIFKRN